MSAIRVRAGAIVAIVLSLPSASTSMLRAQVVVTPQGSTTANKLAHTTGNTQSFRITNEASFQQTFNLDCTGASSVTSASCSSSVTVDGDAFKNVTVTYSTGNEGSGQLYLTASNGGSSDQGWVNVPVVLPAGAPRMSVLPYLEAKQDYSRCAASCFAAMYAQGTVPYFSLDQPRNISLVYNGDRVAPKPFVAVDVFPDTTYGSWPSEYQFQVKVNDVLVTFVNLETTLRFVGTSGSTRYRIGGQFTPSGVTHGGVYPMEIIVTAIVGGTNKVNRWITQYLHIDDANSAIARGWTLAGVQRAYIVANAGILITEGGGNATYFKYNPVTLKYEAPAGDFSALKASGSTWVRSYPDSTKITFNSAGEMVRVANRFGVRDTVLYVFGSPGKVSQIRDHLNNIITLAYDANGLDYITDPFGRNTQVTVDASKRLTAIQDPDAISTTFGYDANLRLRTITNRAGKTDTLNYLVINTKETNKLGSVKAPSVPVFGGGSANPTTVFQPWQTIGVPYSSTVSTPFPPIRSDTVFGRIIEPGGALTRFSVNRWGSPNKIIQPAADGARDSTLVTYTLAGLPTRSVRPGYGTSDFDSLAYNGSGLVTFAQTAQSTATRTTFGAYGQPLTVATQGRDSVTYFRGALGRLDSVRVGSVTVERYAGHDNYGRPQEIRRPGADTTKFTYYTTGPHRNLNTASQSGGRTATYRYDYIGRPRFMQNPVAPHDSVDYGVMNQVVGRRQVTAGNTTISTVFQYDSLFHVTQVTDPKNQTYRFRYNALGWLIRQEDPASKRDTLLYSIDGDLRRRTTRRDLNIDFTYDSLHRVKSRIGADTVTYSYPVNGRWLVGSSPAALDSVFLNVRGQPDSAITRMSGQRYARKYHYTSAGLQDSLDVSGGVSLTQRGYGYDTNKGLLTSIKLGSAVTTMTHDGALLPSNVSWPGSAGSQVLTFGSLRAPVRITTTVRPDITERWLGFDQVGRVQEHLTIGGMQGRFFAYDSLGRYRQGQDSSASGTMGPDCPELVSGSLDCNSGLSWTAIPGTLAVDTFDIVGNRTSKGGTYATNTNRITAFDGCIYVTDAAGSDSVRTCGSTITNFGWNAEGQLTSLAVTGQPTASFQYDAFGRLVKKTAGGTVSLFLWDRENLLAELSNSGTGVTAEYSYYPGLDKPHAVIIGGNRYYTSKDGVGNVISLTSEGGNVVRTFAYNDWGKLVGSTDSASYFGNKDRARWKGALWLGPETEIYYMRNRWYEPRTGRFISEDPLGIQSGTNPYVFGRNDPINRKDADGLCDGEWWVEFEYHYDERGNKVIDDIRRIYCVGGTTEGGKAYNDAISQIEKEMKSCSEFGLPRVSGKADANIGFNAPGWVGAITWFGAIQLNADDFLGRLRSGTTVAIGLLRHEMYHIYWENKLGAFSHKLYYFQDWISTGFKYSNIDEEKYADAVEQDYRAGGGRTPGTEPGLCRQSR